MKFWECFYLLCDQRRTKPNIVAKDLNISSATVTGWKKGSPPNSERLEAIADYFGVSTDYLLGRSGADPELPDDERELLKCYRRASTEGKKIIQATARASAADPEEQERPRKGETA